MSRHSKDYAAPSAFMPPDGIGDGTIVECLGAIDGSGTVKLAEGVWQTPDRRINYSLVPMEGGRSDLFVSFADRNDVIRILNWSDERRLGVTLPSTVAPPLPASNVIVGDFIKQNDGTTYAAAPDGSYVSAGSQPGAADALIGMAGGDAIRGLGGNDGLAGCEGDDLLEGGDGSDLRLGGRGADRLDGGGGDDFVCGSTAGGFPRPAPVGFTPVAAFGPERARGFDWVAYQGASAEGQGAVLYNGATVSRVAEDPGNVIDGGLGRDHLYAGTGADVVHGGEGDDYIVGMHGADVLYGQAGHDNLSGDGPAGAPSLLDHTPGAAHGADVLRTVFIGSAGNAEVFACAG